MCDDNVEEDEAGGRVGDDDVLDGEPHEELQLGETGDVRELAVAKVGLDDAVEEHSVLVLGQARPFQENLQAAVVAQVEGLDGLGQQARRQPVSLEYVVDRLVDGGAVGQQQEQEDDHNVGS